MLKHIISCKNMRNAINLLNKDDIYVSKNNWSFNAKENLFYSLLFMYCSNISYL